MLPWKAASLWVSARHGDVKWFVALLILNTFAILDIFYLFYVAKKTRKDVERFLKKK